MRRSLCISLLLTLGGMLLPLAVYLRPCQEPEPAVPPSVTEETTGQALSDSSRSFLLLEDGETVRTTAEEYLPCVLAAEMPVSFEPEAFRAQAVAARTYLAYCMEHENPKHPQAQVCADSSCCMAYISPEDLRGVWGADYDANLALVSSAVRDTDGKLLVYGGAPILASFHSSSAGMTEDGAELWGQVPYLKSVHSPETENDVPGYVSTVEVSPENLRDSLLLLRPEAVFGEDPSQWVEDIEPDDSGRVHSLTAGGAEFSGPELRKLFLLRSTAFTLDYSGGVFTFTVTGYGHGLGMSQYGANVLARKGFTWQEILLHYYTDASIV